jgi:hypothetical protein
MIAERPMNQQAFPLAQPWATRDVPSQGGLRLEVHTDDEITQEVEKSSGGSALEEGVKDGEKDEGEETIDKWTHHNIRPNI